MAASVTDGVRVYKYCVLNDVAGQMVLCNTQREAEELAESKRKHDCNAVKGLPASSPLVQAARKRANGYAVGAVVYLS
jgi:hypothetical protein